MKSGPGRGREALPHFHLLADKGMEPVMDRQFGSVIMGSMSGRWIFIWSLISGAAR